MSESRSAALRPDIASVLQSLVQQQTAIFQQQAALLQVHGESVRLQRLLIERVLGCETEAVAASAASAPAEHPAWMSVSDTLSAPPPAAAEPPPSPITVPPTPVPVPATVPKSISVEHAAAPDPLLAAAPDVPVTGANASRAALYYQQRPSRVTPPVTLKRPGLELMRRLHEVSETSSLILQFGPFKGATLAQVAMHDPEYIRQLVYRAERPEVRAAACRLVSALEDTEEHAPRAARGAGRRASGSRAGPRG